MADPKDNVRLVHVKPACENCSVRRLCLPVSIDEADVHRLSELVHRKGPVKRGETIYKAGQGFTSLFAIQAGAVKTYGLTAEGQEQITGFHLPGELMGMDAINHGVHPCHAVALENTWLCEIPYDKLEALGNQLPSLHREVVRIMSREIMTDHNTLMMVGKLSAEQRIVRFLDNLYQRIRQRMGNVEEFRLPMTREDIANYLGLTQETVSRVLARLRDEGVIELDNRRVRFTDMEKARQMVS